jgi:hypothetical protein
MVFHQGDSWTVNEGQHDAAQHAVWDGIRNDTHGAKLQPVCFRRAPTPEEQAEIANYVKAHPQLFNKIGETDHAKTSAAIDQISSRPENFDNNKNMLAGALGVAPEAMTNVWQSALSDHLKQTETTKDPKALLIDYLTKSKKLADQDYQRHPDTLSEVVRDFIGQSLGDARSADPNTVKEKLNLARDQYANRILDRVDVHENRTRC